MFDTIPPIGLGVFRSPKGSITVDTVLEALKVGYRHIDTAAIYGNEQDVGQAIKQTDVPREEIFVTTKLWNREQGYDSALRAFDRSQKLLDVEVVDLYLLHFPVTGLRLQSWRALERLLDEGRVRAIGVSNFLPNHLEELLANCNVSPMINQIEAHPFQTQVPTREYCMENNILVSAYSPLVKARKMDHPLLLKIAENHGKTVAQVLLRWSIDRDMIPLPKSNNPARIAQNFDVFDFQLSESELLEMDGLNQDMYTGWSPVGIP